MPLTDLPLDELRAYQPERAEPPDFDAFWRQTLDESRAAWRAPTFTRHDAGLATIEVFDVTFTGFGGDPVKAWLFVPRVAAGPLPCVVEYPGYGGGRGLPYESLLFSSAGLAHLLMDVRGQGSVWSVGETPDHEPAPTNPHYPGFMTRGIASPHAYYYRRVIVDAVAAVAAARAHPAVDAARVAVMGGSQGGALSIAAGSLVPDVTAVCADVPFLCDFRRAAQIAQDGPYLELAWYCKVHRDKVGQVFGTLGYFDMLNFAARATAPALFSVGLMDDVCPPSTVFAAYHHYAGPKDLNVWEFNGHEGGEKVQHMARLAFLRELWA